MYTARRESLLICVQIRPIYCLKPFSGANPSSDAVRSFVITIHFVRDIFMNAKRKRVAQIYALQNVGTLYEQLTN